MKTTIGILILALCTLSYSGQAKRRIITTARATSYDVSDNLDLEAVASIFGESRDLEDFEYRLNDPDSRISNLDLNEDGYIDYLRVIENSSNRNSLVIIQAVLDRDVYQDVATLEIERMSGNNHRIQIVGDPYIYGSNYIIEPVFVRTPLIFSFFWGPRYNPWQSPYYWNYYPRWYHNCRPYSPFKYHRHIHVHVNRYNKYNYTYNRNIHFSGDNYSRMHRDDYANQHPNRAFNNRHEGVTNRRELIERRSENPEYRERESKIERSVIRQNDDSRRNIPDRNERIIERNSGNQGRSDREQPRQFNREREQKSVQKNEERQAPSRRQEIINERPSRRIDSRNDNAPQEKSGSVRIRESREVKQKSNSSEGSGTRQERKRDSRENRRNE